MESDINSNNQLSSNKRESYSHISPSSRPNFKCLQPISYASAVTNTPNVKLHNLVTRALHKTPTNGIADSATSRNFGPPTGNPNLHQPIQVAAANGGIMTSIAKRSWNLAPELTAKGQEAHEFREMMHPLVSLPQLVDDGCEINLTKTNIHISKNNKEIIRGPRDPLTRMWIVPFTTNDTLPTSAVQKITLPPKIACNAYTQKSTADLITYHHITLGSVAPPTLIQAIKNGYLTTFPGLTVQAVQKYLPKSIIYYMSHIHKIRKNTRSTRKETIEDLMTTPDANFDALPPPRQIKKRLHQVGVQAINIDDFATLTGVISTDQTGRFPTTSRRGNKYEIF